MTRKKFLKSENLSDWLDEMSKKLTVLVPKEEGGKVVFRPYSAGCSPILSADATISPKGAVFPSCQELLSYTQTKDPEKPGKVNLQLDPKTAAAPKLVFGARPCGARGFTVFDRVYNGDKYSDPYFQSARENTLLVTLTCERPQNTCFCHWVGSGPDDAAGSDVLATATEGGYVLEAVSQRGDALLGSSILANLPKGKAAEADAARKKCRDSLGTAPSIADAPESLMALFDNLQFWEEVSSKCLSCGTCTYLCPTCYCFTITDDPHGLEGQRIRSWDNCMSYQFTLEASGHNPRPTKAHRLRNRVGHKFSYYPSLHGGALACCGCGRCIRSCPASVDIREIVLAAIERANVKKVCEVSK